MISDHTFDALDHLADPDAREKASVEENNPFLFPLTSKSEHHTGGWAAVQNVCGAAEVAQKSSMPLEIGKASAPNLLPWKMFSTMIGPCGRRK